MGLSREGRTTGSRRRGRRDRFGRSCSATVFWRFARPFNASPTAIVTIGYAFRKHGIAGGDVALANHFEILTAAATKAFAH